MSMPPAPQQAVARETGTLRLMPTIAASGEVQMAVDDGLLDDAALDDAQLEGAPLVMARRYVWTPPALSLGKFQRVAGLSAAGALPFDVVRRPSGGRAVLHGEGFEWSFAVVFSPGTLPGRRVDDAYEVVSAALAEALGAAGLDLDEGRTKPYRSSALCFASGLRHDLFAGAGKVAAVAQVRRGGAALVHGSVLERRPPDDLVAAVERLLGEPWQGEGLVAARLASAAPASARLASARLAEVAAPDGEAVWAVFVRGLADALGCAAP